jgi:hypothetical protein
MKVAVQHLKPGDVLSGSGEEVVSIVLASINLPTGYASVTLQKDSRYTPGKKDRRTSQWRKNTIVNIRDDV